MTHSVLSNPAFLFMFYQNKAGLINTSNLINSIENYEHGKLIKRVKIKKKKLYKLKFKLNMNGNRFLNNIAERERERNELNSTSLVIHTCYYIINTKTFVLCLR